MDKLDSLRVIAVSFDFLTCPLDVSISHFPDLVLTDLQTLGFCTTEQGRAPDHWSLPIDSALHRESRELRSQIPKLQILHNGPTPVDPRFRKAFKEL